MATPITTNIVTMLSTQIRQSLQRVIIEEVTKELVKDFEGKARVLVTAEAEKLTLHGVEHLKDLIQLRDDINVHFKYTETNGNS